MGKYPPGSSAVPRVEVMGTSSTPASPANRLESIHEPEDTQSELMPFSSVMRGLCTTARMRSPMRVYRNRAARATAANHHDGEGGYLVPADGAPRQPEDRAVAVGHDAHRSVGWLAVVVHHQLEQFGQRNQQTQRDHQLGDGRSCVHVAEDQPLQQQPPAGGPPAPPQPAPPPIWANHASRGARNRWRR